MKKNFLLLLVLGISFYTNAQIIYGETAKIVGSDRASNDRFGYTVSIDGDYAVVGAYSEDEDVLGANTMANAGSAYIFEKDVSGNWVEVQKIVASDRAANDYFGWSVSISGDYLVVGAYQEDEDELGANTMTSSGSAYVFERDLSGVWVEVQKLVASDRAGGDSFGYSVSISSDLTNVDNIVIGAFGEDEDEVGANTMSNAGSAYIYNRDFGGTWNEVQKLVTSDRAIGDLVGTSVSLNGGYLILSARAEDEDVVGANTMSGAGSAYIFEDIAGTWTEVQKIVASDRNSNDVFGGAVSISGLYAIVSAYNEDEDVAGINSMTSSGSAYIFERSGGVWGEVQKIVASDRAPSDNYGWAVSISGNNAVVGSYREDEDADGINTMSAAGSSYILERDGGGTWSEIQKIVASDRFNDDYFGGAVGMSGTTIMSGAYKEDEDVAGINTMSLAGSVYIYDFCMTTSNLNEVACASYTVPSGDETYTTSGIYMDTIPNVKGCDSVMTIDLTINQNTTNSISPVVCATYTVPSGDETYTTTGIYMDTIPNTLGCDSVITVDLTVQGFTTSSFNESACISYTVPSGDETYTSSGIYMDTIPSMGGCDSIMTIDVSINTTSATINEIACETYTVPSGDETYTTTGIYLDTIPNTLGCDSLLTIDLTVNFNSTSSITEVACETFTVPSGDESYTTTGIYMDTIPNLIGCDSIITIDLTINYNSTASINEAACFTYTVPSGDETYTVSGIYMDTIPNINGCDSVMTIDLTVNTIDVGVTQNAEQLTSDASGATYQWIDCNDGDQAIAGETNQQFTATANGDYAVIVTENGCSDTSDCYSVVGLGIIDLTDSGYNIYPNPTNGLFTIQTGIISESYQISITDVLGKIVYRETCNTDKVEIDLSDLEGGVYVVQITHKRVMETEQLILSK